MYNFVSLSVQQLQDSRNPFVYPFNAMLFFNSYLYLYCECLLQTVISGAEALNTNVDKLLNNMEEVHLKLELTKNEFHGLRNTQFIENRVYEDDETLEIDEHQVHAHECIQ